MRQAPSDFKQHLNAVAAFPTAEPVGDVGVDVDPHCVMRPTTVLVKITIGGTGSIRVGVRVRDRVDDWGVVGESDGFVNFGAALAAGKTYYFLLRDVGSFKRFFAVAPAATSGAPEVSVWFQAVIERGD